MVALLGLLQHVQITAHGFLVGPGGAVDALQLRVLLAAPPVRRRSARQLEGVGRDASGRGQVRSTTQVAPQPLARPGIEIVVDRELGTAHLGGLLVAGTALEADELQLVRLELELGPSLVVSHGSTGELLALLDDLLHALLQRDQVLRGERSLGREVVVEAVLDRRPDAQLGAGKEVLDGLRQDMRGRVPEHRQALGTVRAHGLDGVTVPEDVREVLELSSHPRDDDRLVVEQLPSRRALGHRSVGAGQDHGDVGRHGRIVPRQPARPRGSFRQTLRAFTAYSPPSIVTAKSAPPRLWPKAVSRWAPSEPT